MNVTAPDPDHGQLTPPQTEPPVGGPARTAAFFDLDKTVIAKSSTLAFSKPFFAQGLLNRRAVLKSSYAQFLFLMSGADHDQIGANLARQDRQLVGVGHLDRAQFAQLFHARIAGRDDQPLHQR